MPAGADDALTYFSPEAANRATDAEGTGRSIDLPDGSTVEVRRQRGSDPGAHSRLDALAVLLSAIETDQRTGNASLDSVSGGVSDVRARLDSLLLRVGPQGADTLIGLLAALLAELERKANVTETQPVSISGALSLPAGAATSAGQADALTRLNRIADSLDDATADTVLALLREANATLRTRATENTLIEVRDDLRTTEAEADFERVAKARPRTGEELRFDDVLAGALYIGAAPEGTGTGVEVWRIVKYDRTATGAVTRMRYKSNVAWDQRATLWT